MSSNTIRFEDRIWTEPYIQVLPNGIPSPIFVFALCPNIHQIPVPQDVIDLPFDQEIEAICIMFRKHRSNFGKMNWAYGKGFVYHRGAEETLVFDTDCHLKEVSKDSKPHVYGHFRIGDEDVDEGAEA